LVWGLRAAECALMVRAAGSSVASWRSGSTRPVRQGWGADGRAVVMGCDERWCAVVGKAHDWRGLVWCTSVVPVGISGWSGLLVVG
jgi:hypothetical protein